MRTERQPPRVAAWRQTHPGSIANWECSRRPEPSHSSARSDTSSGSSADSTLALITLSFANRSLTFNGDGGGQRAAYVVTIDVQQGSTVVRHFDAHKIIRVASFHETQRDDESVIFQQFLSVPPGTYSLSVSVRDENSGNSNVQQMSVTVPRFGPNTLVDSDQRLSGEAKRARLDTVPSLIANPRSTIVLGRDTLAGLYIEGYGLPASAKVGVAVLNDAHVVILRDTVNLVRQGELSSALLDFPVASIGVGPVTVVTSLAGATDSVQAPLFLSFGDEFGITSFDELLSYLRYFVSPQRIQALRDAPPEQRAALWADILEADGSDSIDARQRSTARLLQAHRDREHALSRRRHSRLADRPRQSVRHARRARSSRTTTRHQRIGRTRPRGDLGLHAVQSAIDLHESGRRRASEALRRRVSRTSRRSCADCSSSNSRTHLPASVVS